MDEIQGKLSPWLHLMKNYAGHSKDGWCFTGIFHYYDILVSQFSFETYRRALFTSYVWKAFCKQLNIMLSLSSGYHCQPNGKFKCLNPVVLKVRTQCGRHKCMREWNVEKKEWLHFDMHRTKCFQRRALPQLVDCLNSFFFTVLGDNVLLEAWLKRFGNLCLNQTIGRFIRY